MHMGPSFFLQVGEAERAGRRSVYTSIFMIVHPTPQQNITYSERICQVETEYFAL